MLNGNINQLGDFDQCLKVNVNVDKSQYDVEDGHISGKYCLAYLDMISEPKDYSEYSKNIHTAVNLMNAHYMINSKHHDVSTYLLFLTLFFPGDFT